MAQRGSDSAGGGWPSRHDPGFQPRQAGRFQPWLRHRAAAPSVGLQVAASDSGQPVPNRAPKRRWDEPVVQPPSATRARLPSDLQSPSVQAEALQALRRDVFAPSHLQVMDAKLRTVERALATWHLELLPPTSEKLEALGATLKLGGYRSASSYFSIYKGFAERSGYQLTAVENRVLADSVRSCERGLGGAVKASALPFDRLHQLPGVHAPWVPLGPLGPRNLIVAGSWFMMREIEVSLARANSVTIDASSSSPTVTWSLPVSKTDPGATGTSRLHGCSCPQGGVVASCPVHALWDQLLLLRRRFPSRFTHELGRWIPDADLPLFPTEAGTVASKVAVVDTILAAAKHLHHPVASSDGSERLSGHSLRVTGAQGLAHLGLDLWAIQLLGRWGSDAVKGYVRQVHLLRSSEWAASAAKRRELEVLVADVMNKVSRSGSHASASSSTVLEVLRESTPGAPQPSSSSASSSSSAAAVPTPSSIVPAAADDLVRAAAVEAQLAVDTQSRADGQTALDYVVNEASGVWHRVARGPPQFEVVDFSSACGWRFGRGSRSRLSNRQFLPDNPGLVCSKCCPSERLGRIDALRAALRQEGE